jgi:predicted nicotinamide N-methyase
MSVAQQTARILRGVARRLDAPAEADHSVWLARAARSTSAPGSRTASMFFDDHPRFYTTSHTASKSGRLNLRYEAIFAENRDILEGAKVLDIASHDGRWSLAALASGAKSVVGIEARPDLVEHAVANLDHYGYGPDRYRFVTGDVHEVLAAQDFDVDVVLCLGFLYHTLRYNELLHGIRKANARHVLIDTQASQMMKRGARIRLLHEQTRRQRAAAVDDYAHGTSVLTGRPNFAAIRTIMDAYGYRVDRLSDWDGLLRDNPELRGCSDYARRSRITIRCSDKYVFPAREVAAHRRRSRQPA